MGRVVFAVFLFILAIGGGWLLGQQGSEFDAEAEGLARLIARVA